MMGHFLYTLLMALFLSFAAVYVLTILISAFRQGWKGIGLIFGVALALTSTKYVGDNAQILVAFGCLFIGSSVTLALQETFRTRKERLQ